MARLGRGYPVQPFRSGPHATVAGGVSVTPGTGVLTADGFTPTVETPRIALPALGQIAVAGFAPVVEATGVEEVRLNLFIPIPPGKAPRTTTPKAGTLRLAGLAPTVTVTHRVTVGEFNRRGEYPETAPYIPDPPPAPLPRRPWSPVKVTPEPGALVFTAWSPDVDVTTDYARLRDAERQLADLRGELAVAYDDAEDLALLFAAMR